MPLPSDKLGFFKHHANHEVQKTLFQILVSQTEERFLTRIGIVACQVWDFCLVFSFIWHLVFVSLKAIFSGLGLCLRKGNGVQVLSQCSTPHRNHRERSWAPAAKLVVQNNYRGVRRLKLRLILP